MYKISDISKLLISSYRRFVLYSSQVLLSGCFTGWDETWLQGYFTLIWAAVPFQNLYQWD